MKISDFRKAMRPKKYLTRDFVVYQDPKMLAARSEKQFAQEVIEECAAFPYGDHDDLVDSTTQAVMRFRQGGFLEHPEDYVEETVEQTPKTYY